MPELVNTIVLQGAPARVWTALTEPKQRSLWGPLVHFTTPCGLGATAIIFPSYDSRRSIRVMANIEVLDKPSLFVWSSGLPWLYSLSETFEVNGDDGGTLLVHSVVVQKALGRLVGPFVLPRLRRAMLDSDERLADYLRARVAALSDTPKGDWQSERDLRKLR